VQKGAVYMKALGVTSSSQAKSIQQRNAQAGIAESLTRALLMLACRQALKPRLLVAVGLGAAVAVYNKLVEQPLGGTEEFALLGGLLSYKVRMLCSSALFFPTSPVEAQEMQTLLCRKDWGRFWSSK